MSLSLPGVWVIVVVFLVSFLDPCLVRGVFAGIGDRGMKNRLRTFRTKATLRTQHVDYAGLAIPQFI